MPPPLHTTPVPLHWQDAVKAGLDRDVRLGVLEPVQIGEPVTWCHPMVICAKQNGTPRRTIDFQPLNLHATRETHHTQSPFHQARSVPRERKRLSSMHGMGTTVYHSTLMTDTTLHSSLLGAATDITQPHKATSPRTMDTPEDKTRSRPPSPTKPSVWTIPYFGLTQSKIASSELQTGWTPVADTGSLSTPRNFALPKTKSNSQASKSPVILYDHARDTLRSLIVSG